MRVTTIFAVLTFVLAVSNVGVVAHPGHDHKLMGTIVSVDATNVSIKTTDGQERKVELTAVTKVLNGKKKGDVRDLKAGMRVVVNVGAGEEPLKAKELQYSLTSAR